MGGNALSVYTERCDNDKFIRLSDYVCEILNNESIKTHVVKSYRNKKTHGDIDIICYNENGLDTKELIVNKFHPKEIYQNSSVFSFDYKKIQIDLIFTKEKYFQTTCNYYDYDVSNFIGRISYQMGFRYGHFGLKLVYRRPDGGRKFEMIVSQEINNILEFLGFNPDKYHEGFNELHDIFDYIVESKYFNPKIFQYEALNHQNKTRNKKRVNYAGFLDYIKELNIVNPYKYKDKDNYVKMAEEYFGLNIVEQIDFWNKEVEKDKLVSAKFNGNIIMEHHPNLRGKELGKAITLFKKEVTIYTTDPKKTYDDWIINNNINHILDFFKKVNNL